MTALVPELDTFRGYRGQVVAGSTAINLLSLALPIVILQVYDRVIPNNSGATLTMFVLGLGGVLIIDMLLTLARAYVTGWTGARVQHKLGSIAIERLFRSDLREFEACPHGVHMQRLRAIDSIKTFYSGQGILLLVDLPFAILFFTLIGLIAGKLALLPIIIICILGILAKSNGRLLSHALEERATNDDRRNNFIVEVLRNIRSVKVLGMESLMVRRYERLQKQSADCSYRVSSAGSAARGIGQTFAQLIAVSVGAYGSTLVIDGVLTIGGLAASTLLASRAAQPMLRALNIWSQFQSANVSRGKIKEILALPQESDPAAPAIHTIKGKVALKNVSFSYREANASLLHDINLRLEPGETIGIAGANGSGKTTLLGLFMGLLVPTEGQVLIDDVDLGSVDVRSLRSQVCYLPQKATLFEGTILENLTMFRGDRYVERAMEMSDRLGLHKVIGRMVDGYETRVEHGANSGLPSGIRQRIALVRALTLIEKPKLLLFDEANVHLDRESDALLREVLEQYRGECSMAVVSHRPSYLGMADRLCILRDGTVQEASDTNSIHESLERIESTFGS